MTRLIISRTRHGRQLRCAEEDKATERYQVSYVDPADEWRHPDVSFCLGFSDACRGKDGAACSSGRRPRSLNSGFARIAVVRRFSLTPGKQLFVHGLSWPSQAALRDAARVAQSARKCTYPLVKILRAVSILQTETFGNRPGWTVAAMRQAEERSLVILSSTKPAPAMPSFGSASAVAGSSVSLDP